MSELDNTRKKIIDAAIVRNAVIPHDLFLLSHGNFICIPFKINCSKMDLFNIQLGQFILHFF